MSKLEAQVKNLGIKSGFDLVGIASAENFTRDEKVSIERVRSGFMDGVRPNGASSRCCGSREAR